MKIDKRVFKESLADVGIGIIIALPISYIVLNICKYYECSVFTTSIIQTTVFTIVAFLRKYFVRATFKKGDMYESQT